MVSPFLRSDDSEADYESEPAEQRPERHESLTPSFEFPLALVVASPKICQRQVILVRPVGPLPARRLTWRRVSYHSSDRHSLPNSTSGSSSSGSSSDSLSNTSSVHSSGQSHSGPSTRDASPRLVDSSSSLGSSSERSLDSSSPSSGPSRKRCRSPTVSVPSSTHVSRSIAPTPADLLPPRKRFRDSYSSEVSGEEHMEMSTTDAEDVVDLGISEGVGAHTEEGIGIGVEVVVSDIREDEEEIEVEASTGGTVDIEVDPRVGPTVVEDIPEHTTVDGAVEITYRQLEAGQLIACGERAGLTDRVRSLVRENRKVRALLCIERDRVDGLRHHMALSQEEFRQVRRDRDDTRRRLRSWSHLLRGVWDSAVS
ncbi:hypothetical protein Tco_1317586 [Tanacetum coccineum]